MQRVRLLVAYHGGPFHGWQIQRSVPTVEGALTEAVAKLCGERVKVQGASRTDAGVHALGQTAAFDDPYDREPEVFFRALNRLTPREVEVRAVDIVDEAFHPRHDARGKVYRYLLEDTFAPSPLYLDRAWHHSHPLDAGLMQREAQVLVGEHDFSSFRATGCEASGPVRRLRHVEVRRRDERLVEVRVEGSAFLKYMVRNIVGSLCWVGSGQRPAGWLAEALAARDRTQAGPTAPPWGLTLERIYYPLHPWRSGPMV